MMEEAKPYTKPHYVLLDGLRGVAALMVLGYHLFEAVAFAAGAPEQKMFNGFLAVDFFFILSGFVMGYAYDSRWKTMTVEGFVKRRLVRLHPMVLMGVLIGVVAFCVQGCERWDGSHVSLSLLMIGTLLALFLLPVPSSLDVRGNTELFPLNGPHWSLFFEYIGSLVYALCLHRLSDRALKTWVGVMALALLLMGLFGPDGSIAYGWSSQPVNMLGGSLRLLFCYPMGLLLSRLFLQYSPKALGGKMFWICSLLLVILLSIPSFHHTVLNVIYQFFCVAVAFPCIVWLAARGNIQGGGKKAVSFLGRLSYPLYAVHYPFIYMYIDWIGRNGGSSNGDGWLMPVIVSVASIVTAVVCMKFYDEPLRRWLSGKIGLR